MTGRSTMRGLVVLGLAGLATATWSAPRLTLLTASPMDEALTAQLVLRPVVETGGVAEAPTRMLDLTVPWVGDLDLDGHGSWQVTVNAPGFWAPPIRIQAETGPRQLRLIPTGSLSWQIEPDALDGIEAVTLSFESTPAIEREDEAKGRPSWKAGRVPSSETACHIDTDKLLCEVPSGMLDIRLELRGFAPTYAWGVDVAAGKVHALGPLPLAVGASVFGHVERLGGDGSTCGAVVQLKPQVFGFHPDPVEHRRLASRTLQVKVDARGFFQLLGVPLGSYDLEVEHADGARAETQSVEIEEPVESRIDTLTLAEPMTLEVWLDPPLDPKGRPWRIQLLTPMRGHNAYGSVAKSAASVEGAWKHSGIQPGTYRLEVRNAHGSVFLVREQSMDAATGPLFLTLEGVAIRGRVTADDEPVAAELVFGTRHRRPNVRLRSNDAGFFEGYLPREGEWLLDVDRVRVPPVEVSRRSGDAYAELDIELPATRLEGTVVEDQIPVREALILIRQDIVRGENVANQRVEDDGTFVLQGLAPGSYRIRAYLGERTSDWQRFDLEEGQGPPPIHLELQTKATLKGHVVSTRGPVAGAWILAIPAFTAVGQPVPWSDQTVTAADGSFEVRLAPESTSAGLLISAPGHALSWQAVHLENNPPQTFTVQAGEGRLALGRPELVHGALRRGALQIPIRELFWMLRSAQRLERHAEGFPVFAGLEAGPYFLCPGPSTPSGPCLALDMPGWGEVLMDELPAGWLSAPREKTPHE